MKKNQSYEVNFATKTVTVTRKFLQDASQMGTDAFDVWDLRAEAYDSGISERQLIARYMASWIPWESRAERLIARVRELAGE